MDSNIHTVTCVSEQLLQLNYAVNIGLYQLMNNCYNWTMLLTSVCTNSWKLFRVSQVLRYMFIRSLLWTIGLRSTPGLHNLGIRNDRVTVAPEIEVDWSQIIEKPRHLFDYGNAEKWWGRLPSVVPLTFLCTPDVNVGKKKSSRNCTSSWLRDLPSFCYKGWSFWRPAGHATASWLSSWVTSSNRIIIHSNVQ